MEGGFPFGMFGDPGDMQKHLQDMAEQMQAAQKVGWADNAINLSVQMTVACINRLDLAGKPEDQAAQVRDAIRVLFPEAVMLVREAREGLT
jgi:peptide deformylase